MNTDIVATCIIVAFIFGAFIGGNIMAWWLDKPNLPNKGHEKPYDRKTEIP
jgi:hypothetical protein